jgi:sarcosine oxidase subunit beta
MPRIVVAGAGATGASVAYHLVSLGAREVVLADRGRVAAGATSKAMGGVRQQFSTAAEVRLARASIRFFEELGPPLFDQVGYLFVATTESGLAALQERRAIQEELGVPVETVDPSYVDGLRTDDVLGAVVCKTDGTADPPAVTRELVRLATKLGVEVREGCDATTLEADTFVIACGPWSAQVGETLGVELPVRPLVRQLLATGELDLPERLPMVLEEETASTSAGVGGGSCWRWSTPSRAGGSTRWWTSRSSTTASRGCTTATPARPTRLSRTPGPVSTT